MLTATPTPSGLIATLMLAATAVATIVAWSVAVTDTEPAITGLDDDARAHSRRDVVRRDRAGQRDRTGDPAARRSGDRDRDADRGGDDRRGVRRADHDRAADVDRGVIDGRGDAVGDRVQRHRRAQAERDRSACVVRRRDAHRERNSRRDDLRRVGGGDRQPASADGAVLRPTPTRCSRSSSCATLSAAEIATDVADTRRADRGRDGGGGDRRRLGRAHRDRAATVTGLPSTVAVTLS